jgi:hypothetical protein
MPSDTTNCAKGPNRLFDLNCIARPATHAETTSNTGLKAVTSALCECQETLEWLQGAAGHYTTELRLARYENRCKFSKRAKTKHLQFSKRAKSSALLVACPSTLQRTRLQQHFTHKNITMNINLCWAAAPNRTLHVKETARSIALAHDSSTVTNLLLTTSTSAQPLTGCPPAQHIHIQAQLQAQNSRSVAQCFRRSNQACQHHVVLQHPIL